jgi:antirestriction protein ArdC|tara:strand:+ start:1504 stop:2421 length:918 start_codon:yes stop_codon:yes gene_type:complete
MTRKKLSGNDLIAKITKVFVDAMKNDPENWTKPWKGVSGMPHNPSTKTVYSGINSFWLMLHMKDGDSRFSTYKGWTKIGGQVRKDEQGIPVVYYSNSYVHKTTGKWVSGNKVPSPIENYEKRFVSRVYSVFHASQVDGIGAWAKPDLDLTFTSEDHRAWFETLGATWEEIPSDQAYYQPANDKIVTPLDAQFPNLETWFGTVAHEFTHWTGHESRLDRRQESVSSDKKAYAKEELVAELGATFLAIQRGVESTPRQDHINYIQSWLSALDNDPKFIQKAATQAWKASQWILDNTTEPAREKELVA